MNTPDYKHFIPLNGKLAIELVQERVPQGPSIWRISAMASNANLEHYKALKCGDLVLTNTYVHKAATGTMAFINPGDILAVYPAQQ